MLIYTIRRLIQGAVTVAGVSALVFLSLHVMPGDPAAVIAGLQASEAEIQSIRAQFRLDDPLHVQYGRWITRVVQGDFGTSYRGGRPIWPDLADAYPVSLRLALCALAVAILLGIPAGMAAATSRSRFADLAIMTASVAGISLPTFWIALLLVLVFSLKLGWLPSSGWGHPLNYVLPVFCLSLSTLALLTRMTRVVMAEALIEDYVQTARAKGQAEFRVRYRHALRNALTPIVTIIGLRFGALVGGAVVVETVFAVPGIGGLIVRAVTYRDFPVVQGGVLLVAMSITFINILVDLACAVLDPRIRFS